MENSITGGKTWGIVLLKARHGDSVTVGKTWDSITKEETLE